MALSERDAHFQTRRRCRQSGQGVTEYILVLIVFLAVIIGVSYQFNDAFKVWANNYFGNYLSCLLEAGELPSIGGTGGSTAVCDQLFQKFSLANGRQLKPNFQSQGGGSSSGSGSSNSSSSESVPTGKGVSDSKSNGENSRNISRAGGSSGQKIPSSKPLPSNEVGGESRRRNVYTGSTEMGVPGNVSSISSSRKAGTREDGLDGGFYIGRTEQSVERVTRFSANVADNSKATRKGRFLVQRKIAKAADTTPDEPMTFGDYFRYILIAALILALLIVVGGQLTQISKEME